MRADGEVCAMLTAVSLQIYSFLASDLVSKLTKVYSTLPGAPVGGYGQS